MNGFNFEFTVERDDSARGWLIIRNHDRHLGARTESWVFISDREWPAFMRAVDYIAVAIKQHGDLKAERAAMRARMQH